MKNSAKKSIALLLTMLMLLGVATPFACAVEQTNITPGYYKAYDEAAEGELIYTANFNGDDYYTPARMEGKFDSTVTAEVADGGKTVTLTGAAKGHIFYGATVEGMTLENNAYTVTYEVTRQAESDVLAGFYVDAEHAMYGFNGFFGNDTGVMFRVGVSDENKTIKYGDLGITPLDLNTTDGDMITQKIKLIVDVKGDSLGYYILTAAANGNTPERYAKIMEVRPSNTDRGYAKTRGTGNLGLILYLQNTSPVTFSNVNVYKGGAMSVESTGELLLSLDSMNEVKTETNGVTYSPVIDQMTTASTGKIQYSYDNGVHKMSGPEGLSGALKAAYGGTTNLRVGNGEKYTITYFQKLHLAGGDVGLHYLTNHSSDYIAHGLCFQWGGGTGQPGIYKTTYAGGMGRYAGYNTGLGQLHTNDGYIFVQIEINDTKVTVYTNGTQALEYDYATVKEMYGLLSLSVFEYKGTNAAGTVYSSYKDIKVYSGNTVSEKYISVIDGQTTEKVGFAATEATYTLPTRTAPEGYVFKGWIVDDAKDEETGKSIITAPGTAVSTTNLKKIEAVYVKAMSEAWVQFGNTDTENNTTDMRIVGVLDSLKYSSIGYDIVIRYKENGVDKEYTTENYELYNVYTSLYSKNGTQLETPETMGFGADSGYYLTAFTIFNVPTNIGEITFELTPYQLDLENNEIPGETITLSFTDLWAQHNASGN